MIESYCYGELLKAGCDGELLKTWCVGDGCERELMRVFKKCRS